MILEPGDGFGRSLRDLPRYLNGATISHGFIAWLFAVTGPLLVLLNAAQQGKLPQEIVSSWIFAGYGMGGVLSIFLSLYYRQPIASAWTIPGAILVGNFLTHFSFEQAVGAYIVTGLLITFLGVSGVIKKLMEWIPMPIILGMVSGVLLPFGINIIKALGQTPFLTSATVAIFLASTFLGTLTRRFPPILWAILGGLIVATVQGEVHWEFFSLNFISPQFFTPKFSLSAAAELVIPLALTVIAVQNGQGFAILKNANYNPPINAFTIYTGVGSLVSGVFGCHSACITGPMNAIISSPTAGAQEGRYAGGVVAGFLFLPFAALAPVAAAITRLFPAALINVLGGLALIYVLAASFGQSFSGSFRLGALFSFMITLSNFTLFNIGSPFWGLVGGVLISLVLERRDFETLRQSAPAK
ncbi:MAG: benzoate/H(+) symporter BenE family transporter [Candidatus Tectomicrobia bacterium]|uniref:Benzoate/H(+) symporter BenE family transporter n=1 Tax=Tectimicrobiota bacterium TaxID=2528274 RepID=A0A932GPK0_UNCTE|nr:benzoate/H(+) symporter BenE family transporter [Candidatus Tectomicrobia bacterium]